jgi:hypothetical protein
VLYFYNELARSFISKGKLNAADKLLNECMKKDVKETELNRIEAAEGFKDALVDFNDREFDVKVRCYIRERKRLTQLLDVLKRGE